MGSARDGRKKAKRQASKTPSLAVSLSNLEQIAQHEQVAAKAIPPLHTQCRIHVHSKRVRLADADGISAKAAIDGAVYGGLLVDDSPQYVESVSFSQSKVVKGGGDDS